MTHIIDCDETIPVQDNNINDIDNSEINKTIESEKKTQQLCAEIQDLKPHVIGNVISWFKDKPFRVKKYYCKL